MPATNPGPLPADILAFILSSNKYGAGTTEVYGDEDVLKKAQFATL